MLPEVETTCYSRYATITDLSSRRVVDLTDFERMDPRQVYGRSFDQGNWACANAHLWNEEGTAVRVSVTCTAWLPEEGNWRDYPALFRYHKGQAYSVLGYVKRQDAANNDAEVQEWLDLGELTLNAAAPRLTPWASIWLPAVVALWLRSSFE